MKRWKMVIIVSVFMLILVISFSTKVICFSDDNGTGKHSGDKNPQTTVVFNEIPSAQVSWNVETVSINGIGFGV